MSNYNSLVERIQQCTACNLYKERTQAVPGNGSITAEVFFIGEGPGSKEDKEGIPFTGRSGDLLNNMLENIGMSRTKVYVTNMVKCRPPKNRDPLNQEIKSCKTFLDEQLDIVRPKIIVTLGRYSFSKFFPDKKIGQSRGKPHLWNDTIIYPIYHPAAGLRNSKFKATIEKDFKYLPELLKNISEQKDVLAKQDS